MQIRGMIPGMAGVLNHVGSLGFRVGGDIRFAYSHCCNNLSSYDEKLYFIIGEQIMPEIIRGVHIIIIVIPYCITFLRINRLLSLQHQCARILTKSTRREHITQLKFFLHWFKIQDRITYKILINRTTTLHRLIYVN